MEKQLLKDLLKQRTTVIFCHLPPDRHADVNMKNDDEIRIDLKRHSNPARNFLHESLHLLFPEMSETEVVKAERRLWRKLNQFERWLVYRVLFRKEWKVDD